LFPMPVILSGRGLPSSSSLRISLWFYSSRADKFMENDSVTFFVK
jgi:hypothetical protein